MENGNKKKIVYALFALLFLTCDVAFAGTSAGGLEALWNKAVYIISDKYLGYLVAGALIHKAYELRAQGETGKAVERLVYAGAFGSFTTMAEQTAAALLPFVS